MIMKLLNNQDYMDTGPTSVPACPTVPLQKAATCRVKDTSMICQVCYYNTYYIILNIDFVFYKSFLSRPHGTRIY